MSVNKEESEDGACFEEIEPSEDLFYQFDEVAFEMTPEIDEGENGVTEYKEENVIIVEDDAGELLDKEIREIRYYMLLRILAMYEAKTAKNSNFCMFWSITLLICCLFKSQQTLI